MGTVAVRNVSTCGIEIKVACQQSKQERYHCKDAAEIESEGTIQHGSL